VVGYNVQVAVDTEHHLIVTHEVTISGSNRAQLANMAKQAKAVLGTETLEAVADRGYFSGPEILACHEAGIIVTRAMLLLPVERRMATIIRQSDPSVLMFRTIKQLSNVFERSRRPRPRKRSLSKRS
jgi:hypothetical protein